MRIALYQPDIPQNTGTIMRMAVCLGMPVELILPAGFDASDRSFRRAGLDYLTAAAVTRHASWDTFEVWRTGPGQSARLVLLTTAGDIDYCDLAFRHDDILLVGRESAGVPDTVHAAADARVRVPMQADMRSLNVAVAAAMVTGEALRQTRGFAAG